MRSLVASEMDYIILYILEEKNERDKANTSNQQTYMCLCRPYNTSYCWNHAQIENGGILCIHTLFMPQRDSFLEQEKFMIERIQKRVSLRENDSVMKEPRHTTCLDLTVYNRSYSIPQ